MGANALSLRIQTARAEDAIRRIATGISSIKKPASVLGFVSGAMLSNLQSLVEGFARKFPGLPGFFTGSDSVFTEQGELDPPGGMVCLVLGGNQLNFRLARDLRLLLQSALVEGIASRLPTCPEMLVASSQLGPPERDVFAPNETDPDRLGWFGAISAIDATSSGVDASGSVDSGAAGRVAFSGLAAPIVVGASCCRLITPVFTVSSAEGSSVLELDGVPALVALGQASSRLAERSWIVVALAENDGASSAAIEGSPNVLFRPVRGIDPAKGAIVLSERTPIGARLAFAVRDDRASRQSLELALRTTKPRLCGGSPRFGVYFDGLGRGRSLYGAANVDLGIIKHTLGDFPIIGMRSAFELRSDAGPLGAQTLTGQLALFRNPS